MEFSPKAFLELISELGYKFPGFSQPLLLAIPGLSIWLFLLPLLSGTNLRDHWLFLLNKDQQYEQRELANQVDLINKLVDEHEYSSFDHQQEMTDQLAAIHNILIANRTSKLQCGKLTYCYLDALRANSNNHEIIRAFLQINRVYGQLLRSGKDDNSVHRFVDDLYRSLSALTVVKLECTPVYQSYSTLRALHNRVDILPEEARDAFNIEVLKQLTFAAAFLATQRSGGICTSPSDQQTYKNAQAIYTDRAREIKNRRYIATNSSEFLRILFWIDISQFILYINSPDEADKVVASEKIFKDLSKRLPPEFLKSKLEQYKSTVSNCDPRTIKLIDKYISQL